MRQNGLELFCLSVAKQLCHILADVSHCEALMMRPATMSHDHLVATVTVSPQAEEVRRSHRSNTHSYPLERRFTGSLNVQKSFRSYNR